MDSREPKELEFEKYICTECYEFGAHGSVTYGNWLQYIVELFIILLLIAIPSLLYFAFLFFMFILARGRFVAIETMDLFPLARFIPQAPHTVKICPYCKRVGVQAKISDANGQTALHFHKKQGMHLRHEKKPIDTTEEKPTRKTDPEEF